MKRVIQDKRTYQFLAAPGRWTLHREEALSFDSMGAAVDFCRELGMDDVRIYCFVDGDPLLPFTAEITGRFHTAQQAPSRP